MIKKLSLGLFLLIIAAALSGCGFGQSIGQQAGEKIIEKAIEDQTGGQVDINANGGDVTIKTEDGQTQYSTGGEAKLPENFPQELVVASDAKIIISTSADSGQSIAYVSNVSQDELFAKYKSDLPNAGWKKEMEVDTTDAKMLNFSKGEQKVVVTVGVNDSQDQPGQSIVHVTIIIEKATN